MNGLTTKKAFEHVYSDKTYALLRDEFPQPDNSLCYLEHAGATLYSSRQISDVCEDLKNNIFANPHARSTSSKLTEDLIDQVRIQILQHFNTSTKCYTVIFTSGATGALKLLAESFCYKNGTFAYLQDNHTSVLGMREYSNNICPITPSQADEIFTNNSSNRYPDHGNKENNSLFVYPAQSNFSGTKYDLNWIQKTQDGALDKNNYSKWYCCLDAASFVSTNALDLSKYQPDFVCLSFYKVFGYPTGLGALIVKNDSAGVLEKNYFGGGTVFMALATEKIVIPRSNLHEKFEDGTLPFLAIISLRHGFSTLKRLQLKMDDISKHTFNLAKYTHDKMAALHHNNGRPLCKLYTDNNFERIENQGSIINFNLLNSDGNYIGFAQVLHIANLFGIQIRTGCFCNPGACQQHLNLTIEDLKQHFDAGHVCGDQNDLIDGQPTGSVRISFGYMSTKKDADTFLSTIADCFCQKPIIWTKKWTKHQPNIRNGVPSTNADISQNGDTIINNKKHLGALENIYIYPIKSCAAFEVKNSWILTNKGLKFDRNWMVVNASGICMTQKQMIGLCKLKPIIDIAKGVMTLHYEGAASVSVPLTFRRQDDDKLERGVNDGCQTKVCEDVVSTVDCGDTVSHWISAVLNQSGLRLLRQNDVDSSRCTKSNAEMSLANQAQYLLINLSSIKWLRSQIADFGDDLNSTIQRFRPNFVVSFDSPFMENDFTSFSTENGLNFASDGHCTRCQMICVNQITGEKTVEPLKTLSKVLNGKISFGVYLRKCDISCDKHIEIAPNCTIIAK